MFSYFFYSNWTCISLSETNQSFSLSLHTWSFSSRLTVTKLLELKRPCFVDPAGNPVKIATSLRAVGLAQICSTCISASFSSRYDQQLDKCGQVDSVFAPFNPTCKTICAAEVSSAGTLEVCPLLWDDLNRGFLLRKGLKFPLGAFIC